MAREDCATLAISSIYASGELGDIAALVSASEANLTPGAAD